MQLSVDDTISEKPPPSDVISELEESFIEDEKAPSSALERERNDIIKVKKVCKCSSNWFPSMLSKLIGCISSFESQLFFERIILAGSETSSCA